MHLDAEFVGPQYGHGLRRRSGESLKERGLRPPLRGTKSVICLETHYPERITLPRQRRATEELTWMPWGPSCVHEDMDPDQPRHLTSPSAESSLPPPTQGCIYSGTSVPDCNNLRLSQAPRATSSLVEPSSFMKETRMPLTPQSEEDPKSRIKTLERDVALLEAKLKAMTAHSQYLESELEIRSPTTPAGEVPDSMDTNSFPIPIPFLRS